MTSPGVLLQLTGATGWRSTTGRAGHLSRKDAALLALLATLERSQDISIAILSRGFDYNIGARTFRREFTFHRDDFIILGIIFALILLGLTLKNLGLSTPTEDFLLTLAN